jgi:hypothetical protein
MGGSCQAVWGSSVAASTLLAICHPVQTYETVI